MVNPATLPRPESLKQPGERLEGQTYVVRKKVPGVHIPESLEGAKGQHVYGKAVDEAGNSVMAYIPLSFDPAENQYPKALYHPDWGKKPEPVVTQFNRGASTPEQLQSALELFNTAHAEWEKSNRIQTCENPKREAELRKIGWVDYKDLKHLATPQKKADGDAL